MGFGRVLRGGKAKVGIKPRNNSNLYKYIRDTPTVSLCDTPTVSLSRKNKLRYARISEEVLHDERLSPIAKLVYAELALWAFHGNVARRGQRAIADAVNVRQATVSEALQQLKVCGHIEIANDELEKREIITQSQAKHQRGRYVLVSPVFASKQRAGVKEIVSSPRGYRRMVSGT